MAIHESCKQILHSPKHGQVYLTATLDSESEGVRNIISYILNVGLDRLVKNFDGRGWKRVDNNPQEINFELGSRWKSVGVEIAAAKAVKVMLACTVIDVDPCRGEALAGAVQTFFESLGKNLAPHLPNFIRAARAGMTLEYFVQADLKAAAMLAVHGHH